MPDEQRSARELLEFGLAPPGYSFNFSRVPDAELERALDMIEFGKQWAEGRPEVPKVWLYDTLEVLLRHECPRFHEEWSEQIDAGPASGGQPH